LILFYNIQPQPKFLQLLIIPSSTIYISTLFNDLTDDRRYPQLTNKKLQPLDLDFLSLLHLQNLALIQNGSPGRP
jgi:hypothetical protein